jgi:hypothetical protein
MTDFSTLVGPLPQPIAGPKWPTPWEARDESLYDAKGQHIVDVCTSDGSHSDDRALAEYLAKLVNQGPARLRDFTGGWFEVEPGWAIYAQDRKQAEFDHTRHNPGPEGVNDYGQAVTATFIRTHGGRV